MTVATLDQPDSTTMDAATYKAAIDAAIAVLAKRGGGFAPHEAATPDMTVLIDAGVIQSGITLNDVAQQTTAAFTAPVSNPRIDRIVIDETTGAYSVIAGTEAASPVAPALTSGKIAIAQVLLQTTSTVIANSMITDERASFESKTLKQNALVSLSGTAVEVSSIPSWAKRITIDLDSVALSAATSQLIFVIGDASSYEVTGYVTSLWDIATAGTTNNSAVVASFPIDGALHSSNTATGKIVFENIGGNTWQISGSINDSRLPELYIITGTKTLTGTLTRIKLTTTVGTATFVGGSMTPFYE